MLSLEKNTATTTHVHTETGTSYVISGLTAKRYNQIRAACTKGDKVDSVEMAGKVADEVIQSWEGVDGECNKPNKIKFGEKFAFDIMPGITDRAMEFATATAEEIAAAKNG